MFDNFISLGRACPTAASMSRYGLRSWSGPFDWLVSENLGGVLHFIETDFADFMKKENLEIYPENPRKFKDRKYDILFIHDQGKTIVEDYDEIYHKYQKKIVKFKKEITRKTCFIRIVESNTEIDYILHHYNYINKVIKKSNDGNEIIFVIKKNLNIPENLEFRYYTVSGYTVTGSYLSRWFDDNEELIKYCVSNCDSYTVMKNMMFDHGKERRAYERLDERYKLLVKLLNVKQRFVMPSSLIIYGAGNIGQNFYRSIQNKDVVKCFVDRDKMGGNIDGVPIKWLSDIQIEKNTYFVVTPTSDYCDICRTIEEYFGCIKIKSLDDILNRQNNYARS